MVGLARRVDKMQELSTKLKNLPGKFLAFKADITNEEDIIAAFKWVTVNLGPVSILINNAGISQPTNISEGVTEMWRKIMDTNVMGASIATREAIKIMKENNIDGSIIMINSILGHYVYNIPNMNMYGASKFALNAISESLRLELIDAHTKIKISVSNGYI